MGLTLEQAALVRLVQASELAEPYVTDAVLRRQLRADPAYAGLSARLGRLVRAAIAAGLLLSDERERLGRDGQPRPVRLLRVNQRHPSVVAALRPVGEHENQPPHG